MAARARIDFDFDQLGDSGATVASVIPKFVIPGGLWPGTHYENHIPVGSPPAPAGNDDSRRRFNRITRRKTALLGLIVFWPALCQASPAQLKKANRLFWHGDYARALKVYDDALVDAPHSGVLHFNAGAAAYQSGDFRRAEREFSESAEVSKDPRLKAAAHYNRGNALFRQQAWDEAIEAYKAGLRINPSDEDAKYNLGVALRAKANPPASAKATAGKPAEVSTKAGQSPAKKEDNAPADGQPKPGSMSKEDADRLLSAAGANELKKGNQRAPKGDAARPDEDW
jgi:Ca-activated chloride channel homolog